MRIGRLRHRITIEQRADTRDDDGDLVPVWVPVAENVPASIEPLSARELIAAQAVQSEITVRIVLRYRSDITAAMRVRDAAGRVYDIHGVIADPRSGREWITLSCALGLTDG